MSFQPKNKQVFQIGELCIRTDFFNFRVILEKHLQYKQDIFHKLIDSKKAFGRVLPDGL